MCVGGGVGVCVCVGGGGTVGSEFLHLAPTSGSLLDLKAENEHNFEQLKNITIGD